MWKLKIAEGDGEKWLTTTNNHVGRQHWEFDPDAGTEEERAEIERVRLNFKVHRFQFKQSADLLMRIQCDSWLDRGDAGSLDRSRDQSSDTIEVKL
ncbi:lupeol synthase [Tanacetum coccineum]